MIAFHSYKGGVGRTKIMAGVGALLAERGYKVGLLDFDLDSSGLVAMFDPDVRGFKDKELLHILREKRITVLHESLRPVNQLINKRLGVDITKKKGSMHYLPTIADPDESDKVNLSKINLFLRDLFAIVKTKCGFDVVLTDVKPGYSPAFKNIMPIASRSVIVTRLDTQNMRGLPTLFEELRDFDQTAAPLLIANMVPESSKTAAYMKMLEKACGRDVDIALPYVPELVFDNDFEFLGNNESPIFKELVKLADRLANNQ